MKEKPLGDDAVGAASVGKEIGRPPPAAEPQSRRQSTTVMVL